MSWERNFKTRLERAAASAQTALAPLAYEEIFPPDYRSRFPPELAVRDALSLSSVIRQGGEAVDLWEPCPELDDDYYRLQLYGERERSLDEIIPLLQNLNLRVVDQVQFAIEADGRCFFIRSFKILPALAGAELGRYKAEFLDLCRALLADQVENDALNGLLIATGLGWQEIDLFRAYRNYYFQLGSRYGRFRFNRTLLGNPSIARLLSRYFASRFRPDARTSFTLAQREEEGMLPIRLELSECLNSVADVNEDHILRDLFNLIDATVRTDFYRPRADGGWSVAFKISSLGVINMPSPRPMFEIFVHSALMNGIHLRGAKVARGGIRWSDRPDDFRTEILDLMQTQQIKNALIVPQGAKGGFVLKMAGATPAEHQALGLQAYDTLIRGMLNLTDNRAPSGELRHADLIAYDEPDPYLVVAADKGTARLSDTANRIAGEYGFWLGDAFASGGSHGYDHKGLGITARGAFECVKRHFRELGQGIETQPFTVVGVGSMDGDVFGNGMLLSESIALRAAFSGTHIFIDPAPDLAAAFQERRRLFELPGSTWNDYDRRLISEGGGVFRRDARDIPLSIPLREWLGVRHPYVDGEELVRLLLTSKVDLLWLGGIGTYVKSASETHEEVGDRGNDPVRVDAARIRAKVVGEGANLGFTQKARIEFALAGGRIDTDAVDNSGGVDLSDHEVNIKILMARLLERGAIADAAERDRWLTELTPDVVGAVLDHNRSQSLCLSLDRERCLKDAEPFLDLADRLVNAGLLDRQVESFPTRKEIAARASVELTRPELAVLMAYAKLAMKRVLLDGRRLLKAPWASPWLAGYFPAPLRERFAAHLADHSLAPEITATCLSNVLVDQAGATCLEWVDEWQPAQMFRAVTAYLFFDGLLGGPALRAGILALDDRCPAARQHALLLRLEETLAACCRWTLREGYDLLPGGNGSEVWRANLDGYFAALPGTLSEGERRALDADVDELTSLGLAPDLARLAAGLERLDLLAELVSAASATGADIALVVRITGAVAERLGIPRMLVLLDRCQPRDRWERRALLALRERFRAVSPRMARSLLRAGQRDPGELFDAPKLAHSLARLQRLQRELNAMTAVSLAPFAALVAELGWVREMAEIHLAKLGTPRGA